MDAETTTIEHQRATDRPRTRAGRVRLRSIEDLDGRTAAARRARALRDGLIADLGGEENVSTAQRALATSAGVMVALVEDEQATWLSGGTIDPTVYAALIGALRRTLAGLGLNRTKDSITPEDIQAMRMITAPENEP